MSKEIYKIKCKICGFKGTCGNGSLKFHLIKVHDLTKQQYYDKFFFKKGDGICLSCNKVSAWSDQHFQYNKGCCKSCESTIFQNKPEAKRRTSLSGKRVWSDSKHKRKMKIKRKEVWGREGYKEKMSAIHKVAQNRPDVQKRKSVSVRKALANLSPYKRAKRLRVTKTPEALANHASAMKKLWADPIFKDKQIKVMLKGLKVTPNKPERIVAKLLNKLYPKEWKFVGNGEIFIAGKNPDFINVNGQKKIIEVYGNYWHKNDKPADRRKIFKPYGYKTLVIWEKDIHNNFDKVRKSIEKFSLAAQAV